jgi:hypothetical protein
VDPQYAGFGLAFLSASELKVTEGRKTLSSLGPLNLCKEFSIESASGSFTASGVRLAGLTLGGKEAKPLRFQVREGKFETKNTKPPKYFAMPLFNCLVELSDRIIGQHPLRIYPTPQIPDGLREKDKPLAAWKANEKNQVAAFLLEGRWCFVERLPDYEQRVASLRTGDQRRITAVLVGEVAAARATSSLSEFASWFPLELFSALGFASGTEVSLPWVEIRDEEGGLIRTLHGRPILPSFSEGDSLLGEFTRAAARGGMGQFLTGYLALPLSQRSCLEATMNHARLGSVGTPSRLYDILDHLIRALECLCREHGFMQQDLSRGLSDQTRQRLVSLISPLASGIRQLQGDALAAGAMEEHRLLSTIQGRAANIATTENKFGLAVVSLLESFGLPDPDILDRFLGSSARKDGLRDWASLLTSYRGATIHEGYMDFEKKHDVQDVARVCTHLKDVIARLVFKECAYDGTYDSPVRSGFGSQKVEWVQPNTTADELGFS